MHFLCTVCGQAEETGGEEVPVAQQHPTLCTPCRSMRDMGLDPDRYGELMYQLGASGLVLRRLPGGFFRIMPRLQA